MNGIGSNFDDFLKEEGIYESCRNDAILKLIAYDLQDEMEKHKITKVEMARKLQTSRSSLDRLLNPANESVTIHTLMKAAQFLGKDLHIEFITKKTTK